MSYIVQKPDPLFSETVNEFFKSYTLLPFGEWLTKTKPNLVPVYEEDKDGKHLFVGFEFPSEQEFLAFKIRNC